jgi:hypothetical protein
MSDTPRTNEWLEEEKRNPRLNGLGKWPDYCKQLERELAIWKHEVDLLRDELAKADKALEDNISTFIDLKEQRDRLAEASLFLADVAEKNTDDTDLWNAAIGKVRELAAVKKETP